MNWNIRDYIALAGFLVSVGATLISIGALVYALRQVIKDVEVLDMEVGKVKENLKTHEGDKDAHVNHLYMASLRDTIKEVKEGNKEINQKLDSLLKEVYAQKK